MAARRAKHAKNELVQMPGKLFFMNLFSKTSLVDVAMLVYIFSFVTVSKSTINFCLMNGEARGENRIRGHT